MAALLATLALAAGADVVLRAGHASRLRNAYLPDLESMAVRHPYDGTLLALLGGRLAEAGEYRAAAAALERAVGAGENDTEVWLAWAAAHAAAGSRAEAWKVLRLARSTAGAPINEAIQRVAALGSDVSTEQLAQAICPDGTTPLIGRRTRGSFLNILSDRRGDPEREGLAQRERRVREHPNDPLALRLWADALIRNRRLRQAETTLQKALALSPGDPELRLRLGDVYFRQGRPARAGREYQACLKARPKWPPALLGLGRVALEKNLLGLGVSVYEEAVKAAPASPEAWIGLGKAYYNQRTHMDQSLSAFRKAAELAPERTDYAADYSNGLRANFKHAEAEDVLRRRLAAEPGDAQAHYLLGLLLQDHRPTREREREAEVELRRSDELQPGVPAVQARLGRLLLRQGKIPDAIKLLEAALEGDPYHVMAQMTLARAYSRAGRKAEATAANARLLWLSKYTQRVSFLEDQLRRQPLNRKLHLELASLFRSGGEPEKAQREEEMAYMLEKHRDAASRGIEALRDNSSAVGLQDP